MSKVSEPCSPKLRACVDHLIAQGKPESSAWAICKAQLGETYRHPDFQKIQTQFTRQCGEEEGLRRYQEWISRLGLDESKSYMSNATMREKFQWIRRHADFSLWKEDTDAKYWRVEAGFPVESMNENVYTKEELTRAARTIKGKTVNLNHKFSLPTVEVLAGEYESDIVECVVRVPNSLHCPICERTKTINDLIESGGIVNVSLEAACDYGTGPHGECEGMNFTGLSLLTKDVLPGIPLTRLMPLESIMVEALQTDETKEVKPKVKKIEMKIVEDEECPEGQKWNPETGECEPIIEPKEQSAATPDDSDQNVSHADREGTRGLRGTLEHPGVQTLTGTSVVPDKTRKEDVLGSEQPKPGEQPPITGTDKLPPIPIAGKEPTVTGIPAEPATPFKPVVPQKEEPASPHECPDGYHFDVDANQCVPNEPITERVKRFQAEDANKSLKLQLEEWKERYVTLDTKHNRLLGVVSEKEKLVTRLESQKDNAVRDLRNKEVESEQWKRLRDEATGSRDDYKSQLEDLKQKHEALNGKYHATLSTNLELSRKLTQANEDYLKVAQDKDRVEEALKRTQVLQKKIIRIKP